MAEKKLSFEKAMGRLEEIAGKLEEGDIALEQSLTLFEEASALIKHLQLLLDQAEQKVKALTVSSDGEVVLNDFENEDMHA